MRTAEWELALLLLASVGTVGSLLAFSGTWNDLRWVRERPENGQRQRRLLVARGYVRDAVVALLLQSVVLVVAVVYASQPPLTESPTPWPIWVIRGAIIACEALLLTQLLFRHLDRVRLVGMIRQANHEERSRGSDT